MRDAAVRPRAAAGRGVKRAAHRDLSLPAQSDSQASKPKEKEPSLADSTVAQLTELATERGIAIDKKAKKADIIEALEASE